MEAAGRRYIYHSSAKDVIKIYSLADIHYGNRGAHMELFLKDVQKIRDDPYAFWVGGGDYADYIGVGDKRFDARVLSSDLIIEDLGQLGFVLTSNIKKYFEPIKHKCLGLLFGNHEDKYQKTNQQMQLHQWLCTELGVRNLGYCALFDVVIGQSKAKGAVLEPKPRHKNKVSNVMSYRIFCHHGAGGAQTAGGKINRLVGFMNAFEADIYMSAHSHDAIAKRIASIHANASCTEITNHDKVGFVTGSYLRTYTQGVTGYGEVKGYAPVPLGALCVEIHTSNGEARVTI